MTVKNYFKKFWEKKRRVIKESASNEAREEAKRIVNDIFMEFERTFDGDEPDEIINMIEQSCEEFKNDDFVNGLAEQIDNMWNDNPTAEDIQVIFVADTDGEVYYSYFGGTDYWNGESWSKYPHRSHIFVAGKEDSRETDEDEEDFVGIYDKKKMKKEQNIRQNVIDKIIQMMRKEEVLTDEASPNFVNNFAWQHNIKDLTSDEVVQISNNYFLRENKKVKKEEDEMSWAMNSTDEDYYPEENNKSKITFYYTDHIKMSGQGIDYAEINGEHVEDWQAWELIMEQLTGDIPEFTDHEVHLYIQGNMAGGYDLLVDVAPEYDKTADKVYKCLEENFDINFVQNQQNENKKLKDVSEIIPLWSKV